MSRGGAQRREAQATQTGGIGPQRQGRADTPCAAFSQPQAGFRTFTSGSTRTVARGGCGAPGEASLALLGGSSGSAGTGRAWEKVSRLAAFGSGSSGASSLRLVDRNTVRSVIVAARGRVLHVLHWRPRLRQLCGPSAKCSTPCGPAAPGTAHPSSAGWRASGRCLWRSCTCSEGRARQYPCSPSTCRHVREPRTCGWQCHWAAHLPGAVSHSPLPWCPPLCRLRTAREAARPGHGAPSQRLRLSCTRMRCMRARLRSAV